MGGSVIVAAKSDQIVSNDRAAARQPGAARVGQAADRPVEPGAHEASTGVAEKEPLKRQANLSKNWRVTPAMIAACDAARARALGYLLARG
jgi:hypothetical protein